MNKLVIKLINWYQSISKHKNPTCRYRPTCSAYAKKAYQTRNFFIASWLSFYRILRCNPFSKGGYDPVPKKKSKHTHDIHYLHVPLKDKNDANVTLNTYLKRPLVVHFLASTTTKDSIESKNAFLHHFKRLEAAGYTMIMVYGHDIKGCHSSEPFFHIQCVKDESRDLAKAFDVYDTKNQCVKLSTFVINEHGQISQQFLDSSDKSYVEDVVNVITN